jgi:uncharacterized protein YdaU (DUF1376 family)
MNARKPPAFQFYPADFAMGCAFLSTEEVGAYILLLCHQWEHGGLPDDAIALQRLCKCNAPVSAAVLAKFVRGEDGRLRNARLEEIRAAQDTYRERIGAARSKAAAARWSKGPKPVQAEEAAPEPDANAMQLQSKSNAGALHLGVGDGDRDREGRKEGRNARTKAKPEPPALPFPSPAFAQAVARWMQHRRERRAPLTPTATAEWLRKCEAMGEARAIAAIEHSIANGWQGMFEPHAVTPKASERRQATEPQPGQAITLGQRNRTNPPQAETPAA